MHDLFAEDPVDSVGVRVSEAGATLPVKTKSKKLPVQPSWLLRVYSQVTGLESDDVKLEASNHIMMQHYYIYELSIV